ncbi:MAG: PAS domain S-box protein [Candidatus Hatepunaea meridiana]|nr:PAS domain S-box protein [Candidatus Hatepunaea meridiana]
MNYKSMTKAQLIKEIELLRKRVANTTDTKHKQVDETLLASRNNLQTLFDTISDFIFILDSQGNISHINPVVVKRTGYSYEELIGKNVVELHPEDRRDEATSIIADILSGKRDDCPVPLLTKDGDLIPVETKVVQGKWDNKDVLFGFSRDITEHKRIENEIEAKSVFLERLIQQSPLPTFVLDDKSILLMVNEAFLQFYAVPDKDLILGFNALKVPTNIKYGTDKFIKEALKGNVIETPEIEYISPFDNKKLYVKSKLFPIFDPDDKLTNVVVMHEDVTERKQAERALKETNEIIETILSTTHLMIAYMDTDFNFIRVNQAYAAIDGHTPKYFVGKNHFNLFPNEKNEANFQHVVETGEPVSFCTEPFEDPQNLKDETTYLDWSLYPVKDTDGEIHGLVLYLVDVTKRMKVEEAIHASESKYRILVDNAFDAIYLLRNKTYEYVNLRFCEITGYSSEELTSPDFDYNVLLTDETKEFIQQRYDAHLHGEKIPSQYKVKIKNKTDAILDIEVSVVTLGKPKEVYVLGIMRDVTERMQAEEALRESEERFRAIVEGTQACLFSTNERGRFNFVNEAALKALGYSQKELNNKFYLKFVHPSDKKRVHEVFQDQLRTSKESATIEFRFVNKSGSVGWFMFLVNPIIKNGKTIGLTGVAQDITKRKRAEEAQRESEEKYHLLVENAPSVLWKTNEKGITSFISSNIKEVYGYTAEEIYQENHIGWFDGIHPDDLQKVKESFQALFVKGKKFEVEYRIKRKDGEWIWLHDVASVVREENDGKYAYGVFTDITERKHAEENLRESEELFRSVVENSHDGIVLTDDSYHMIYVNDKILNISGYIREELIGQDFCIFFEEESIDEIKERYIRRQCGEQIPQRYEINFIRKDGEKRHAEISAGVMRDSQGKMRTVAQISDITERKRAERELERLSSAMRMSKDSIVLCDLEGKITDANEATLRMYGIDDRADLIGKNSFEFIVPEDRSKALASMTKLLEKGHIDDLEYRIHTKDGGVIPVELSTSIVRNEKGEPTGLVGVRRDITERRQAEKLQNAIYRIAREVDITKNLNELFTAVHIIIQDVMPAENFFIALYDEKEELLSFPYFIDAKDIPAPPQKLGKGLTEYVLRTGKPLLCNEDCSIELENRGEAEVIGIPSEIWLGVPLKVEDKIIGVMGVQHYTDPDAYSERELQTLEFFSSEVARAINHKRAEDALKESEDRYRRLFEDDLTGDYISTPDGRIITCNPSFAEILGFSSVAEAISTPIKSYFINPEDRDEFINLLCRERKLQFYEKDYLHCDGHILHIIENTVGVFDESGKLIQIRGYIIDNTERKNLEEQLRQSQKMEGIGRLAGGIAHDFNNLLTAIICNSEMAMESLNPHDPLYDDLGEIMKASDRAADLVRQLLAFSRKQTLQPSVLNLNTLVADLERMLIRMIGEDIEFNVILEKDIWAIKVDPGQIEQVIVNLVINARDAMSLGGKLTVETQNAVLGDEYANLHSEVISGDYVMLTVSDTGHGMTDEIKEKIFDPFFTTKGEGQGTGLGLSTVYGIIKQSNGHIWVYSEVEQGTSFKIFFPRVIEEAVELVRKEEITEAPRGTETILVVEDEDGVRNMACKILKLQGYEVIEADSGGTAYMICQIMKKPVDLIVTDVIMPYMSGSELVDKLREMWPDVKVLYMSGYTVNSIVHHGVLAPGIPYMQKPFRPLEIALKVREVLDS